MKTFSVLTLFLLSFIVNCDAEAVTVTPICVNRCITFSFSGTIDRVDDPLGTKFQVGQSYSGYYTFDPLETDLDQYPNQGTYSIDDFYIKIGDYTINKGDVSILVIMNYVNQYVVNNNNINGGSVNEAIPFDISLMFNGLSHIILESVSLPPESDMVLSSFPEGEMIFSFDYQGTKVSIAGEISSLSTNIPGDINQDSSVNLSDAILALQVTAGIVPTNASPIVADVNCDRKIGIEEAVYILRQIVTF